MLRDEQKRLDVELAATTHSLDALRADLTEADELIGQALDIAQRAGDAYRQAPDRIRRLFNQLLFDKLDIVTDEDGNHQIKALHEAPFDILFSARTRALVAEAQTISNDHRRQVKESAVTGGLSLDILSDQCIALVEGSNKSIVVDLRGFEPLTS